MVKIQSSKIITLFLIITIYSPFALAQLQLSTYTSKLGETAPTFDFNVGDTLVFNYRIVNQGSNNINTKYNVNITFPDGRKYSLTNSIVCSLNNEYAQPCCIEDEKKRLVPTSSCTYTNSIVIPPNYPPNPSEWADGLFKYTFTSDDGLPMGEYKINTTLVEPNNDDIVIKEYEVRFRKGVELPTITLASCQEITRSGNYVLDRDIILESSLQGFTPCLNVHDVNNIQIDCRGHTISAIPPIGMSKIDSFSIKNCIFEERGYERYGDPIPLNIEIASNGIIFNNVFKDMFVHISRGSNININGNRFGHLLQQEYANNNLIKDNIFNFGPRRTVNTGVIVSIYGSNNKIISNSIDGGWDGVHNNRIGADDGIVLDDESNIMIDSNLIKNNWDCGIETGGIISNAKIINNQIVNNDICGIGGWYANSWIGNEVSNNLIDRAPTMFLFYREGGLRLQGFDPPEHIMPADTKMYFLNNNFKDNRFINPFNWGLWSSLFNIPNSLETQDPRERSITPNDVIVGNNVFTNNNFGTTLPAPYLKPENMIVDGGGNICGRITEPNYPIQCGQS